MIVRTETQGSNSWVMIGFTYAELVEKIGCSEVHIRKIVNADNGFEVEKGTSGRNGKPAIVWMSESKLKALIVDMIANHASEMKGEKRGRVTGDTSSCKLYSCFHTIDDKINMFEDKKPKKNPRRFDASCSYSLGDCFYAIDGTVCQVIPHKESNFFVSKIDGEFSKVYTYHELCGEHIVQSTNGKLFSLSDVYFVEISRDGSIYNPTWIRKSRKDAEIIRPKVEE